MGHTRNGMLIGQARHIELREQRDYIRSVQDRAYGLRDRMGDALADLRALDPAGWEAWYDDSENVPEFSGWANSGPAVAAVERRVEELRNHTDIAGR